MSFGRARQVLCGLALLALTSCAGLPKARLASCSVAPPAAVTVGADGLARARLDVMIYNIEGLQWPARQDRKPELKEIGRRLAALRASGDAPDVIMFQEVFSRAAQNAVQSAGYPAQVAGPARKERRTLPALGRLPGRKWRAGELGVRLASGGLLIVSRYPIVDHEAEPFSHRACAGRDCLSNKGALYASIAVPGVPEPIDLFNSHLNSRHASGASSRRSLTSHHLESRELADFIADARHPARPAILGGDFNMRHSEARFAVFDASQTLTLVHRYCHGAPHCDVEADWEGDKPWLDTQDLQFFQSGERVEIRPVSVRKMFEGGEGGPVLSDHSALRVVYELSWKPDVAPAAGSCVTGAPQ